MSKVEEYAKKLQQFEEKTEEEAKLFNIDDFLLDVDKTLEKKVEGVGIIRYKRLSFMEVAELSQKYSNDQMRISTALVARMLSKADPKVTLEKTGAEIVETLAAMAVYNPFFEKAGMKLGYVYTGDEKLLRKYVDLLERYGFDPNRMYSYSHLKTVIMNMPDDKLKSFQMELSKISLKRTVGGWLKLKNRLKTGEASREKLPTYLMQYATLQTKTYYYYWLTLSTAEAGRFSVR